VSLINQVLKDVEARQGGTTTDGWGGQQVKPVLSHSSTSSSRWIKRLLLALVLVGLGIWAVMQRAELISAYWSTVGVFTENKAAREQAASPVKPLPAPVVTAPAATVAADNPTVDAHPQLTKSLFSEWQAELSESVTKPAIRQKITPVPGSTNRAPAKSESAPQVEGEFSIKPAESGTVVSVIEPPLESSVAGKKISQETTSSESNE
jgi:MSHA biogenesis protein MshN